MNNQTQCNIKEPHSHLVAGQTFECEKGQVDTPGGVPKEEKCVIGNHDNCTSPFCPCYPDEDIKKIRLNQLKDEMENEYKKLIVSRGIEISAQGIFVIRDFISSHLQKTYEVAEKVGYEKCKADLRRVVEGDDDAVDTLEEIIADLSIRDTK